MTVRPITSWKGCFMKKLFGYLRDYKKECVLGPLFKLLEAAFELLVPLVMAAIITGVSSPRIIWRKSESISS